MAKTIEIGPYSAYAIAVKNGFSGTEQEWLASLVGPQGPQGASVIGAKIDASQHLIITVHDPATGGDTEIDAGEIGTTEAVQAVQQAIQQAGQSAVSAVESAGSTQQNAVASAGTQAVSAIGSAQQTAVQQVQQAGQTAINSAQQEAEKAAASATAAAGSATQAAASATAAQQSQNAAAQSATLARDSATAAKSSQDAAAASATQAAGSASDAAASAEKAKQAAANSGLPQPTAEDVGKVPTVNDDGTGYELAKVQTDAYTKAESDARYAPIEAAIRPTVSGNPVTLEHSVAWAMQGLNLYGKSTQDGTPSPENPVPIVSAGASGSIETTITGKNLLTGRLYYGGYATGIAFIENENAVSLPYTPTVEIKGVCYAVSIRKGITYTFSVTNPNTNARLFLALYRTFEDASNYLNSISNVEGVPTISITASEDGIIVCLIASKYTDGKTAIHECTASELLQFEIGQTATAYEAPHAQSIVAATPNGLPGIPVDSGGNYTDGSGQQWVCDEVDFGRGVYVQRIQKITSYTDEDIDGPYMSTTGQLTTGATVIYVLAAPIETPLSAEELSAYAALRTYDGTTIVSTEAQVAGLLARYVADGAAYIDSKTQSAVTQAVAAAVSLTGGAQ